MSLHIHNFNILNTSCTSNEDFHFSLELDCTVYEKGKGKIKGKGNGNGKDKDKFIISHADFVIEFKTDSNDDPFVNKPSVSSGKLSVSSGGLFVGSSSSSNSAAAPTPTIPVPAARHLSPAAHHETPVSSNPGTPISSDPHLKIPVSSHEPNPFLFSSHSALMVLGQLTTYATTIMGAQYHMHMFMVLIIKDYARLI